MPISKAFILGAGLGTRLQPLTHYLPKPLVPVWNAPLITYAFDHVIHDLDVSEFLVNTHHLPERYPQLFPDLSYRDCPIQLRHEPTLLDTAGGLDNIRDWVPQDQPFLVYNGDILTDLPLGPALAAHEASDHLVTLILRSTGQNPNVGFDPDTGKITDMRGQLGVASPQLCQFTGIYIVSPAFMEHLTPGKIESVVEPFLQIISSSQAIGGVIIDDGHWSDLGDQTSYIDALSLLGSGHFPRYGLQPNKCRIHPFAQIDPTAQVDSTSTVGQGAIVGPNALIEESTIWPHTSVGAHVHMTKQVNLPEGHIA